MSIQRSQQISDCRDTLQGMDNKILIKAYIDKLAIVKSNLEFFIFSLVITIIYFYSTILLNAEKVQQIQKNNLIKRIILLIYIYNYYLLPLIPLLFIVIKEPKKSVRSKFKIKQKKKNKSKKKNNSKKENKGKKVAKERKNLKKQKKK